VLPKTSLSRLKISSGQSPKTPPRRARNQKRNAPRKDAALSSGLPRGSEPPRNNGVTSSRFTLSLCFEWSASKPTMLHSTLINFGAKFISQPLEDTPQTRGASCYLFRRLTYIIAQVMAASNRGGLILRLKGPPRQKAERPFTEGAGYFAPSSLRTAGIISLTSPTRPRSATLKMGAVGSGFMATMQRALRIP